MLKRSKKIISFEIDDNIKRYINLVLSVIDKSFQTTYKKLFNYVYLDQKTYTLDQIANNCYKSFHTTILDIEMLNKIIESILIEFDEI